MESRVLTDDERDLRRNLKAKLRASAAMERIRWKQRARLLRIRVGNANTKLFYLRANGRRRKNHIPNLTGSSGTMNDHMDKANLLLQHFSSLMGSSPQRERGINWSVLNLPRAQLQHLDEPFTLQEIKTAVFGLHSDRASGTDGFTASFFKRFWLLIGDDICRAINQLFHLRADHWNLLNSANIILIPKSNTAASPSDYKPISLMHSIAKIFCKIMANRLAPELHNLISD